ncbi:MAG: leucyl/phenylalanyl-tRNA--protein transferase [Chitinophagales bacterium]|nr:leucyl/phenylalanyl-tRNA--protein transferase [Chitinophagales bacterium]MDW8427175.1 leucyl/phenylalanyl-tRNA--protein transferase [Chitinophagales bacterium]
MTFISGTRFPHPEEAAPDGLVGISLQLTPPMVIAAYRKGIFPWHRSQNVVFWYSPPIRMVLFPTQLHISHSLRSLLRKNRFHVTVNKCFHTLIQACAQTHQRQKGLTWIDEVFIDTYTQLHELGKAISIEVWQEQQLAGGLYGVVMGSMFCGESIFSALPNAGKIALVHLCRLPFEVIDCQLPNPFLEQMGAQPMLRHDFLKLLNKCLRQPDRWPTDDLNSEIRF